MLSQLFGNDKAPVSRVTTNIIITDQKIGERAGNFFGREKYVR